MNEIYNEGRVVGYSAEEIFNKLFRALYPNDELPTTKEWLSAGMGMGASFALHINKTTDDRSIVTYTLPGGSDATNLKGLSGRYLIVAAPIFGTVVSSDDTKWITEFDVEDGTAAYATDVGDYSKILNGVISYGNDSATIKLLIDGTCNCNVLFTGFLNKKILKTFALSATTEAVGSTYTDIDDFGNTLTPDISQIFFARPNYREYFKANVVDTDDTHGSLIDISQVNNNSSTLSTSASIITPTSTTYSNKAGKDNGNIIPNVFSVQQHTNGTQKINPSLYFYNSATGQLEPIDSDAKGAVNIIKRDISTSPKETVAQLKARLANMSAANPDKIFLGAWTDDTGKILNIWLPDGTPVVNPDAISVSAGSGISVVQTIDPNDNSVDYKVSANLTAGAGVSITGNTDGQPKEISANLVAGSGIEIVDDTGTPAPKKISTKISSGAGITIITNQDGSISISATATGVGYNKINQVTSDTDDGFKVIQHNQFCSWTESTSTWDYNHCYLDVRIIEGSNIKYTDVTGLGSGNPPALWANMYNVYYYTKVGNDYVQNAIANWNNAINQTGGLYIGRPDNVSIRVTSTPGQYSLGKLPYHNSATINGIEYPRQNGMCLPFDSSANAYDPSSAYAGFALRHANGTNTDYGKRSRLFGIRFCGKYSYLNPITTLDSQDSSKFAVKSYSFLDTSGQSTGIWNVRKYKKNDGVRPSSDWTDPNTYFANFVSGSGDYSAFGASWSAVCRLEYNNDPTDLFQADYSTSLITDTLLGYAGGYPDGYNGQLPHWSKLADSDAGKDLGTCWINLLLSGTFYLT